MVETGGGEADRAERGLGYGVDAPYYDVIFPRSVRDALTAALRELVAGARAVAEIGPATGLFTEVLLDVIEPDGEIFAIEPTRIMRAALMARLACLPGGTDRVTVLAEDALAARVDVPLDAVVLFNVIMHFPPEQRPAVWRKWAAALRPGGLLVMDSPPAQVARAVPPMETPGGTVGRHRFDRITRAEVVGDDVLHWVMTYRTWHGDDLIREEDAEFDFHIVSHEMLAAELSAVGLERHPSPEGIQAWRRP